MKKIITTIALTAILVSCNKETQNGYEISGTANGVANGTKIYLQVQGENELTPKDTVVVENNAFTFKGNTENTQIGFLTLEGNNGIPFILENGKIKISFTKDSIRDAKISGTTENELFQSFGKRNKEVYSKITDFQKANQEKFMTAQSSNDTVTMKQLQDELKTIQEELKTIPNEFIAKNPSSFLSVILTQNSLMQQFITIDEANENFKKFDSKYAETAPYIALEKMIKAATSVEIGKKAPDFSAPSPDGKTISLKESLGKVTIIDFWASWCGPCRMENPNVVALYNELHEKGLNIIGVSLDREETKWKEAIEKDGLVWNHVSNLKFWQDPIAEMYNVKAIPTTFILDENGVIIAKDLRGAELKTKIEELLNN